METETTTIRVCFISPKAYPLFNPAVESVFGGAEVDLYMIATELAKDREFEVSFVVADYGQADEEMRENVRIIKSVNFRQNPMTGARKIWAALKKADADVYMMKTASPGVPLVRYFCRRYNRRFIYKTANQGECDGKYRGRHPILGRLFVHSLKAASAVIVQNQRDHDNLAEHFSIQSAVIPNGHRIPEAVSGDKKHILWAGRSAAVKGPRRFLELAKAFPDEPFVMICQEATGDDNYRGLCEEAAGAQNLTFVERVPFHEIDGYFEQAKVFVNTSDSEGFPNTFIQAAKAGAAILSYLVNPDGFLDGHGCGLAGDGTMNKTVEQLRTLLEGKRFLEYGSRGRDYVRGTHDIERIIETYKSLFRAGGRG